MISQNTCLVCKKTDDEIFLNKCTICFKRYCDEHAHLMSGRNFCSKRCADYFFFPEDDDESEDQ